MGLDMNDDKMAERLSVREKIIIKLIIFLIHMVARPSYSHSFTKTVEEILADLK